MQSHLTVLQYEMFFDIFIKRFYDQIVRNQGGKMYSSASVFTYPQPLVYEKGYSHRLYSSIFDCENLYAVQIFILLKLNWKKALKENDFL